MPTSPSPSLLSAKVKKKAKSKNSSSSEEQQSPASVDQATPTSNTQEPIISNTNNMRVQEGCKNSGEQAIVNVSNGKKAVKYRECRKNHAANIGGYAVDGCREFMASGEEGSTDALLCAACNCHRNFHKKEMEEEVMCDCSSISTNKK